MTPKGQMVKVTGSYSLFYKKVRQLRYLYTYIKNKSIL